MTFFSPAKRKSPKKLPPRCRLFPALLFKPGGHQLTLTTYTKHKPLRSSNRRWPTTPGLSCAIRRGIRRLENPTPRHTGESRYPVFNVLDGRCASLARNSLCSFSGLRRNDDPPLVHLPLCRGFASNVSRVKRREPFKLRSRLRSV